MKLKRTLFIGIILLTIGIILRVITNLSYAPVLFIIVGVLFKTYYVIGKAKKGEYKPGYELIFLFIGLLMLLSGIYLSAQELTFKPFFLVVIGIVFKVIFVILFIVNIRSHRKNIEIESEL